jgi:RNA polymerase sporulation-specific sigma factor
VDYDDLFQLAGMGLLKAINGFDESFGVRFSTYAVPMIAGEIKRFMRDDGSIKVSRQIKSVARDINKFVENYSTEKGRQPTVKEIGERFNMPESEVVFTMGSTRMPISLFATSDYKDEKSQLLIDKISVDDKQEDIIDMLELRSAIDELAERDKKVIILRYFRDMTQSEVACEMGVSQVQVSRIESRIMESFKKKLTG